MDRLRGGPGPREPQPQEPVLTRRLPLLLGLALLFTAAGAGERPLLITVDDLPVSSRRLHPDDDERLRITGEMLSILGKHRIRAVGLVTWGNVGGEEDLDLLRMWLEAGHELGNHSHRHLSYSATEPADYIADVESARQSLQAFLAPYGRTIRFFRFPMLREGDTPEKLRRMRAYLAESGQRNLPVTVDNQDWSYELPWVEARRSGDRSAQERVLQDYQAALRLAVRHHERTGDEMFDRELPQILLLHATEVSGAGWDELFTWLRSTGHRFATADEVLADPAFAELPEYVGDYGPGLWDRFLSTRRESEAREQVEGLLREQSEAWNRGDLAAFCSIYAEDAVFLSPTGVTRGRQAVMDRYLRRFPDRAAMGTLTLEPLEARTASGTEVSMQGDARPSRVHGVSVAARWTLRYPDREDATGLTLIVFRRHGDRWEIVQDASM